MKAMSGVLESPQQALSVRRIMGLVGAKFENRLGQKRGLESDRQLEIHLRSRNLQSMGQTNQNERHDHHSNRLFKLNLLVPS